MSCGRTSRARPMSRASRSTPRAGGGSEGGEVPLLRRRRQPRRPAPRERPRRPPARERPRRAEPRGPIQRAPQPPRRRGPRSDLGARILVAVPAGIVVIALIDVGKLAWAVFLIAFGIVCLHELYRLLAPWKPVPVIGFAAVVAMVLAARYGSPGVVLEVGVAVIPALFVAVLVRGQRERATFAIAATLL